MIKKLFITSIIIYLGLILMTSSPFQANNLFQDKTNTSVNDNIQSVYAQKNGDDDDDDNSKEDDDDDDDDDNSKEMMMMMMMMMITAKMMMMMMMMMMTTER